MNNESQMNEPRRKFVFSHHPCIDGVASAWALQQAFPQDDIRYQGLNHNEQQNFVLDGEHYVHRDTQEIFAQFLRNEPPGQDIYFVDYVPNDPAIIEKLLDAGHKVTIYDHHHTALHKLSRHTAEGNLFALTQEYKDNPRFTCVFDEQRSGATIAWNALHPDTPPHPLLQLIEKMDLLTFSSDEERLAACYIDGYTHAANQKTNLRNFTELMGEFDRIGLQGMAEKGTREYAGYLPWMRKTLESARTIDLMGQTVTVVDAGDITRPPRGLIHAVIDKLTQGDAPPVVLMVDNSNRDMVKACVRVHPRASDLTHTFIEKVIANEDKVQGGGRGTQGQIGQGMLRMPPATAIRLGIITERERSTGRSTSPTP